jgi:hypothetical protein
MCAQVTFLGTLLFSLQVILFYLQKGPMDVQQQKAYKAVDSP